MIKLVRDKTQYMYKSLFALVFEALLKFEKSLNKINKREIIKLPSKECIDEEKCQGNSYQDLNSL